MRQAILNANTNAGSDTINFNIKVGDITEVPIPTANSGPAGITAGPDGNLWFTEDSRQPDRPDHPRPAPITEFPIPHHANSIPIGITAGPDGNLWFTEVTGRPDRADHPSPARDHRVPDPHDFDSQPVGITAGPDGNLWFTEDSAGNRIGRITPDRHAITEFPLAHRPTAVLGGITAGPDGNLWFTENAGDKIGRITTSRRRSPSSPIPTRQQRARRDHGRPRRQPLVHRAIRRQPDRPDHHQPASITEFPTGLTAGSVPDGITAGPDGNLWFTEAGSEAGPARSAGSPPTARSPNSPSASRPTVFPLGLRPDPTATSGLPSISATRSVGSS